MYDNRFVPVVLKPELLRTLAVVLLLCSIFMPVTLSAQSALRTMKVERTESSRVMVFQNYPDNAALYITSSIPGLQIDSNLGVVADESEPGSGIYRIIIAASRQTVYFDAPGYIRASFPTGNLNARDVVHLSIEPEDRSITETGSLIIRSNPPGARIIVAGLPGEYLTPHTFTDILAQTYTVRVLLEDYQEESFQVRVDPLRPVIRDVALTPDYGFLSVGVRGGQLLLTSEAYPDEYRQGYTPDEPLKLPIGVYNYRFSRPHFQEVTGSFEITPLGRYDLPIESTPLFSTVRVRTNTTSFRLNSPDNDAPASTIPGIIYLERGLRRLEVSAPGHETAILSIRSDPGASIDTTVTLITLEEAARRRTRESLPQGVLALSSDVDAEIFVNGEFRGTREVSLLLQPNVYDIEVRHKLGRQTLSLEVPSADQISHSFVLRPDKGRAVRMSMVLPGSGHLYTKRSRGYLYMAGMAGALSYGLLNHTRAGALQRDQNSIMEQYHAARSTAEADRLRAESQKIYSDQQAAYGQVRLALGVAAAVYVIQFADILGTTPEFGYRGRDSRVTANAGPAGVTLRYAIR